MGASTSLSQLLLCKVTIPLVWCLVLMGGGVSSRSLVAWTQYDPAAPGSYLVLLPLGTPTQPQVMLTLDLNSSLTSLTCSSNLSSQASFHPSSSSTFHKLRNSSCSHNIGRPASSCSYLAQDNLTLIARSTYSLPNATHTPLFSTSVDVPVPQVLFQCSSNSSLLAPPNSLSIGVAGFSHGRQAMPSQIAHQAGLTQEFAYCLPPEGGGGRGPLVFGSRPEGYAFQIFPDPPLFVNIGKLSHRAPLTMVKNGGYAVSLQDIGVGGEPLKLRKPVKLYISTTDRYTRLERSVYRKVRASFRQHIGYGNITSGSQAVRAVPPFDTCVNATSASHPDRYQNWFFTAERGQISLVLSGDVEWGFFTDALVYPTPDVMCLAILDAGRRQPSVLGTFQQRGRLLHFDLRNSSLAMVKVDNTFFSFPMMYRFLTCSHFV